MMLSWSSAMRAFFGDFPGEEEQEEEEAKAQGPNPVSRVVAVGTTLQPTIPPNILPSFTIITIRPTHFSPGKKTTRKADSTLRVS